MNTRNYNNGFTILESLVAIAILALAISAVFGSIQKGFQASSQARERVTAGFLAQEAIETIRHVRDRNVSSNEYWLEGLEEECAEGDPCIVSAFDPLMIERCTGGDCPELQYNESNGQYGYKRDLDWKPSYFTREVTIQKASNTDNNSEATVSVTVKWGESEVMIEETLYRFVTE